MGKVRLVDPVDNPGQYNLESTSVLVLPRVVQWLVYTTMPSFYVARFYHLHPDHFQTNLLDK